MRYPASETAEKHEQILTEAARLFRERGFAGAGVAEIMKAAGLTHGAFYAHFPSKGALAAEAVARAFAQSEDRIYASATDATDPKRAFLDSYLSSAHRDRPGEGCAIAALGPEIARDPAVRGPFTEEVKRMIAADGRAVRVEERGGIAARRHPSAVGRGGRADPGTRRRRPRAFGRNPVERAREPRFNIACGTGGKVRR